MLGCPHRPADTHSVRLSFVLLAPAVISCFSPPQVAVSQSPQSSEQIERFVAVAVDSVAAQWRDSTGAICIGIVNGARQPEPASRRLIHRITAPRHVFPTNRCPRTYTTMINVVDSLGRSVNRPAKGYVDPHVLTVSRPQFIDASDAIIEIRETQGTTDLEDRCTVHQSGTVATASCETVNRSIH